MLLTESAMSALNESYEAYDLKVMPKEALVEWIEAKGISKAPAINESDIDVMAKLAQLQENYINETNFTQNIATFTNKLQPLLRRVAPQLMAFDVIGVQPVSSPSSSIFLIKAQYSGTTADAADKDASRIIEITQPGTPVAIAVGDTLTDESGAKATVIYVNTQYATKAVVNVTSGTWITGKKFDVGATYTAGANDLTVGNVYANEASFKQILPGYSGPYTTAQGEVLGADMRQLRVRIVDQAVTLKTRKLKAEITLELIQDMKAMHGASADQEIMTFLEREIVLDLNTEIIDELKAIATVAPSIAVATTTTTQGRWAQEMYSGMYDVICNEKRKIAKKNGQGPGNVMIATSGVLTALQRLGVFTVVDVKNNLKRGDNHATNYAGTLDDGTAVYEDWFATAEYAMVLYKGAQAGDNALIYSPYQPIMFHEAKSAIDFQPVLGVSTRYGLTRNTLKDAEVASSYVTYIGVDFTNTPLK